GVRRTLPVQRDRQRGYPRVEIERGSQGRRDPHYPAPPRRGRGHCCCGARPGAATKRLQPPGARLQRRRPKNMIPGLGTALNTGTVLVGATLGLTLGRVIPPSLQQTIRIAIGLFVMVIGIQMALKTHNPLVLLVSVLVGVVVGELLRLDDGLQAIGTWAEQRLSRDGQPGRVSLAFITT